MPDSPCLSNADTDTPYRAGKVYINKRGDVHEARDIRMSRWGIPYSRAQNGWVYAYVRGRSDRHGDHVTADADYSIKHLTTYQGVVDAGTGAARGLVPKKRYPKANLKNYRLCSDGTVYPVADGGLAEANEMIQAIRRIADVAFQLEEATQLSLQTARAEQLRRQQQQQQQQQRPPILSPVMQAIHDAVARQTSARASVPPHAVTFTPITV